jgi:nondiscriminating glutamyl-tRNA synthetase
MNAHKVVRVRFAPSPTGFMHLGNVRAALLNYLFAKQKHGVFVLRIEDTDQQRNFDEHGKKIMEDLAWLGLSYDEGPVVGGHYAPYYQSERTAFYQNYLDQLEEKNLVYRCFCTTQELETKRQRQVALKKPPRYDRVCACLPEETIAAKLAVNTPFIWRFELDTTKQVTFYDLARKTVTFDLKHFSDFPLTRQDGSFTFLFANIVDDIIMRITHVMRGEDHLTNTASQIALYEAFEAPIPVFLHLPIMGNKEGKKLSKRDFGFSLNDLKDGGFLPEAVCNYLALIGGGSFEKEIMSLETLVTEFNFDTLSSTGQVRYDLDKLRWINHHWIMNSNTHAIAALCYEFLKDAYPVVEDMLPDHLIPLIKPIQQELVTLEDSVKLLAFYFTEPEITDKLLEEYQKTHYKNFFQKIMLAIDPLLGDPDTAVKIIQAESRAQSIPTKEIFALMRVALTGKPVGPSVKDLMAILDVEKTRTRLKKLV